MLALVIASGISSSAPTSTSRAPGLTAAGPAGAVVSNAAVGYTAETSSALPVLGELVRPRSRRCPDTRKGLAWYRQRYLEHRKRMGLDTPWPPGRKPIGCADALQLARVWRGKAQEARERVEAWWRYHYAWWLWLPDKWRRIGACETGYGKRPGNWRHSNSSYEGAFGFAKSSWDAFVPYADPKAGPYPADAWMATPRQQYEVALAIYRRYGFSGWGCRGA